ncbi:hypothetical protein [Aureimonas sp. ME7]|uniref:DUF7079 family protein n=1 Tax=Aureimonas sp. ME7 TaxID=2744252 RepID=UPI0015F51F7A|nr:hypothetical protein [Aureimonas sp. ME7]
MEDRDVARRMPVWMAFSELFLDTELTEAGYRSIRRTLLRSGYGSRELRDILEREVAPVLHANLLSGAGVWDGWDEAELRASILARLHAPGRPRRALLQRWLLRRFLEKEWARIDPET